VKRATSRRHYGNLQRHDHRGFVGWTVRVWRGGRQVCFRYFSDLSFGGKQRALEGALDYRCATRRA
jgi:hypothetical protein